MKEKGVTKRAGLFTNAEKRLEIVIDVHCCSGRLENCKGQRLLLMEKKKNRTKKLYVDRVFVCKPVQRRTSVLVVTLDLFHRAVKRQQGMKTKAYSYINL